MVAAVQIRRPQLRIRIGAMAALFHIAFLILPKKCLPILGLYSRPVRLGRRFVAANATICGVRLRCDFGVSPLPLPLLGTFRSKIVANTKNSDKADEKGNERNGL
jgi:hypothetical protein